MRNFLWKIVRKVIPDAGASLLFISVAASGQEITPTVRFSENPAVGDTVQVEFLYPDAAVLPKGLYCIAYINDTLGYPRAQEIPMAINANGGRALVPTSMLGRSILCVFSDSSGTIYNNQGKGYWTPLFKNGIPIEGAFAGIADMYAGPWPPESAYNLRKHIKLAHDLYQKEFAINPDLKRKYFRYYLASFDLTDAAQKQAFRAELDTYATVPDLTEWEVLAIAKYYDMLAEPELAARYESETVRRYPKGSRALQNASLPLLKAIYLANSFDERLKIYQEYTGKYMTSFPDDFTERVLTNRKSQMLGKILQTYNGNEIPQFWLTEVRSMDEEYLRYAYKNAARMLLEESNNFVLAEKFAAIAVDKQKNFLNAPRVPIERLYSTDRKVRKQREISYGEYLEIYGKTLMLQKKYHEARPILEAASVRWCKRTKAAINQLYIESLILTDMREQAISEMDSAIAMGKTTEKIHEWHSRLSKDKSKFVALKAISQAGIKAKYENQLIDEKVPDTFLTDILGNQIYLDDFRGKTIVIDCWASWCAPCIAGFPAVKKLIQENKANPDVVFLFVNTLDKRGKDRARDLFEEPFRTHLLFDDANQSATSLNVSSLPTKIIIDKNFRIRLKEVGVAGGMQEQVDQLSAIIELVNQK